MSFDNTVNADFLIGADSAHDGIVPTNYRKWTMMLMTRAKLEANWRKAHDVMLEKSTWWMQQGDRTEYEASKKAAQIAAIRLKAFGMSGP